MSTAATLTFGELDNLCLRLAIYVCDREKRRGLLASPQAAVLRTLNLKKYFWNVLIALDQFGNTLLAGAPDETISSRLTREDIIPILGDLFRKILNKIDKNHTVDSHEYDSLGLPDPHHLPGLGKEILDQVMKAGDAYLSLPDALLNIAEEAAKLQRLRESGMKNCPVCGKYV